MALAENKNTPVSYDSSVGGPGSGWYYGQPPGVFEPMSDQINEMSAGQADPHELSSVQKPLEMPSAADIGPFEMASVQTPKLTRARLNN